ncbi:MAG: XkdX family protein [Oscillospiraceae bacterium]
MLKFLKIQYMLKNITKGQLKTLIGTKISAEEFNIIVGEENVI